LFDRDAYLAGETVRELDEDVRALIAEHGIRNALLTSVAPTGTISLVADNVSSGIEPVFALAYTRKVLQPDGSRIEEEVSDYALRRFRTIHGDTAALPAHFVTAQDLTPAEHVRRSRPSTWWKLRCRMRWPRIRRPRWKFGWIRSRSMAV
jgi:ribonucleoside-diphosphate reductase alpha chain